MPTKFQPSYLIFSAILLVLALLIFSGYAQNEIIQPEPIEYSVEVVNQEIEVVTSGDIPMVTNENIRFAEARLNQLTTRQKIAQLMVVWAHGQYQSIDSERFETLRDLVLDEKIGGLMFSRGNIYDQAVLTNRLQQLTEIPLWITQDMEFGAAMRLEGTTRIVPAMGVAATGNVVNAWHKGKITALEAKAVGVHQIFAPVADINNNPENPVINTRSFSEDPAIVARYVDAFVRGAQSVGVMATAKHFPGHGDTSIDSHYALPVISVDWARLNEVELEPFRAAIDAGVGSIMTAHIAFPALATTARTPATLDPAIINGILRDSLGFEGLIVTDALEMRGITLQYSPGEAVVMALNAGADILLAPRDIRKALDEAEIAVAEGKLSEATIDRALKRFLAVKASFGLFDSNGTVDIDQISLAVNNRYNRSYAGRIARESVTLLRNRNQILPINPETDQRIHIISISNTRDDQSATALRNSMRRYNPNVTADGIDLRSSREEINAALRTASRADLIVLALPTAVGGGYRNDHPAIRQNIFTQIRNLRKPVIAAAFGNPLIIESAGFADVHVLAWAATAEQYEAFTDASFGASAVNGRLNMRIGRLYEANAGYYIPQQRLRRDHPESVGLSSEHLQKIDSILVKAISDRIFPGAAVAVVRDGVLVKLNSFGYHDYDQTRQVQVDDVFDLASITKVMATTLSAMRLIDQDKLSLDTPVSEFFPSFQTEEKSAIRVRHLLEHTSGLPAFRVYVDVLKSRVEIVEAILNEPLINNPGEVYVYSDLGLITLGLIVEHISGKDLNQFARDEIYIPLGLLSTTFNPANLGPQFLERVLPTENDTIYRNKRIQGVVHDERAYYLDGIAGHAGLFSTAADLAVLVQMLINEGWYNNIQVLNEETLRTFITRQAPLNRRGLGFDLKTLEGFSSAGQFSGPQTYGHLGFTGTSFWIDPDTKTGVILLTNRTYPFRGQTSGIAGVRAAVSDIVFSSYIE
jgi:beta-N-acetylhexosaminidase